MVSFRQYIGLPLTWLAILLVPGCRGSLESLLKLAVERNDSLEVKRLVSEGANVNAKFDYTGREDRDPLPIVHIAVRRRSVEALGELLAAGAGVNATDGAGMTASIELMTDDPAHPWNEAAQACLDMLVKKGIDLEYRTAIENGYGRGTSALCVAAQRGYLRPAAALLKAGAKVDGINGRTPLSDAGTVVMAEFLMGQGASPTAHDGQGWGVLHYYARGGHSPDVFRFLATREGVDINAQTQDGQTASHICAGRNGPDSPALLQILLDLGADTRVKNRQGMRPIDVARKAEAEWHFKEYASMVKLLEDREKAAMLKSPSVETGSKVP